jgi:hypothetical protein
MEIACQENSLLVDPADLAFQVRAVNAQMREHWAPAYLEEPWPVRSYTSLQGLSAGSFWPMAIMDDIDSPGALGFHGFTAGLTYGRVLASRDPLDATTLSHEALELRGDPRVNLWIPMPDGRQTAREMCDTCEADRYDIEVTLGTETRRIWVSDFVLPAWFVPGAPRPYTYLDTVDEPFGLSRNGGGYRLVRDHSGEVSSEFGREDDADDRDWDRIYDRLRKKAANPLSRSARRGLR